MSLDPDEIEIETETKTETEPDEMEPYITEPKETVELPVENLFVLESAQNKMKDVVDSKTIFILCNDKTDPKPPGKEPSETIPPLRVKEFEALAEIRNWRQILCNDFEASFQ
jgi:hypothetical protein